MVKVIQTFIFTSSDKIGNFIPMLIIVVLLLQISGCEMSESLAPPVENAFNLKLNEVLQDAELKGISATIIFKNGKMVECAAGLSTEQDSVVLDMLFGSGSITKTFTSTIIMKLVESGACDLEDPIEKWLPDYPNIDPEITIRNLLNHTSGLFSYTDSGDLINQLLENGNKAWKPEEILGYIEAPNFEKNLGWEYSNTNYLLLGMIIESVSGQPYSSQLTEHIFAPLNLDQTALPPFHDIENTLAHPWAFNEWGTPVDIYENPRMAIYTGAWSAGAILSTSSNIAQFGRALFEGELLSQESLDEMLEFEAFNSEEYAHIGGYGLGLMEFLSIREYWGHSGDIFGYGSQLIYVPQDRLTIAFHVNQDINEEIRLTIATQLIDLAVSYQDL